MSSFIHIHAHSSSCYSFGPFITISHTSNHIFLFFSTISHFSLYFFVYRISVFYYFSYYYLLLYLLLFLIFSYYFFHTNSWTLAKHFYDRSFYNKLLFLITWQENRFLRHYLTVCVTYTLIPFPPLPPPPPLITRLSTFWPYTNLYAND